MCYTIYRNFANKHNCGARFRGGENVAEYSVSTSRTSPSCLENSLGTPLGAHIVDGKIGEGLSIDTVFKGRVPVGTIGEQSLEDREKNLITSRIMRLRGLEPGVNRGFDSSGRNVDTYSRYVYIHGTNQESKIGSPNSHGCVLLSREDMRKLFNLVPDKSLVLIVWEGENF